jgi:4'-phosphopantetheinyl transferase
VPAKVFVTAIQFTLADWSDERIERVVRQLPASWVTHIQEYRLLKDRVATLLGRYILQNILQENKLAYSPEITIGEKDKPFFFKGPYFNISHSGKWVVVVVSEQMSVGIDVEKHRKVPEQLADKYFTQQERQRMMTRAFGFFDYWAAKEAVIKADGRGVEILGRTFETAPGIFMSDGKEWRVQAINLGEGYSCCLAAEADVILHIHFIDNLNW